MKKLLLAALILLGVGLGSTPEAQESRSRQVTLFGIQAFPGQTISDPKLSDVLPQLRRLMPDHGFRLLGTENERLAVGQQVRSDGLALL